MKNDIKVLVYTRVYNTQPYLKQCIDSILSQTYTNFRYLLIDNGCTDGSSEIMRDYAAKDGRIRLIRFETNRRIRVSELLSDSEKSDYDYVTLLDSDDWWEPDYLEKLVKVVISKNADIACTGTLMHMERSSECCARKVENRLVLNRAQFAEAYPFYHALFRTTWAKLIRMEIFLKASVIKANRNIAVTYGADTIAMFTYLQLSNRVCLDASVLHHYRIHSKSSSHQYGPKRFDSDVYLYNDAVDFLSAFGPVSAQNRQFLQLVYANAVSDTLGVIDGSNLTPAEKLREYARIASHPITLTAYRQNTDEAITRSRSLLLQLALKAGLELKGQNDNDLRTVVQTLLPHCGPAVTGQNLPLIVQDKSLLRPFLADEPEPVLRRLLKLIAEKYGVKKYNLVEMVQVLAANNPLLSQITDTAFLRRYGDIYLSVWRGEYYETLEEMTGLLLENRVNGGKKAFLELYISLAAALSQESAFIFGKLQMAALLLKQGDLSACQAVVADLEEMGLTDNEELDAIREGLEKRR